MWKHRNHYDLLEIPREASASQIRHAFRVQMRAWHPDKFGPKDKGVAEDRTRAIGAAYATLSDEARRADYERLLPPVEFAPSFEDPLMNVGHIWKRMAAWMKDEDVGSSFLRRCAYRTGDLLDRSRPVSEKLHPYSQQAWGAAIAAGFDPLSDE